MGSLNRFLPGKMKIIFCLLSMMFCTYLSARPLFSIEKVIKEVSASVFDEYRNGIWSFGDGGKNVQILAFTNLVDYQTEQVVLDGANVYDWEAMVKDEDGNLWILDVGDNARIRSTVKFYKINIKTWETGKKLYVERELMVKYPTGPMDCEAAVFFNNHIYLFEKNSNGENSRILSVDLTDASSSLSVALEIGRLPKTSLITDAGLDQNNNLILLNYWGIYSVRDWTSTKPKKKVVYLGFYGQQEALVVFDSNHFLLGVEKGKFYEIIK